MADKLWKGRFSSPLQEDAESFNDSLPFDRALWREDIRASISHAKMLGDTGIISKEESKQIVSGLESIYSDIETGKLEIEGAEDIHSFVEGELTNRIGDAGKKLHTARSRNDQVATDFRLYVLSSCKKAETSLKSLVESLLRKSEQGLNLIMPGYTHLRKAQPMCAGHFFDAYCEMFLRDIDRFSATYERANVCPLGSGALAGTSYPIDREQTAKDLGFKAPCENSIDGVSDRDYVLEYLFDASMVMEHLSRLSEDLILYTSSEFGFFEISDEYSTGSSIMPQKKNPDMQELVRGKCGRVYGHLMSLLITMKGLPLAYDKDLQEDKECLLDAEKQVLSCVDITAKTLDGISFNEDRMVEAAGEDFCCATDIADYLAKKGLPFRSAHEVTGKIVRYCIEEGKALSDMTLEEYKSFSDLFSEDVLKITPETCANARTSYGGASKKSVERNIASIKERLKKY